MFSETTSILEILLYLVVTTFVVTAIAIVVPLTIARIDYHIQKKVNLKSRKKKPVIIDILLATFYLALTILTIAIARICAIKNHHDHVTICWLIIAVLAFLCIYRAMHVKHKRCKKIEIPKQRKG